MDGGTNGQDSLIFWKSSNELLLWLKILESDGICPCVALHRNLSPHPPVWLDSLLLLSW